MSDRDLAIEAARVAADTARLLAQLTALPTADTHDPANSRPRAVQTMGPDTAVAGTQAGFQEREMLRQADLAEAFYNNLQTQWTRSVRENNPKN